MSGMAEKFIKKWRNVKSGKGLWDYWYMVVIPMPELFQKGLFVEMILTMMIQTFP